MPSNLDLGCHPFPDRPSAEEGTFASFLGLTEASSVWERGCFHPPWMSHRTILGVAPVPAADGRAWTGVSSGRASRQTAKPFRSRLSSLVDTRRATEQDLGPRSRSNPWLLWLDSRYGFCAGRWETECVSVLKGPVRSRTTAAWPTAGWEALSPAPWAYLEGFLVRFGTSPGLPPA